MSLIPDRCIEFKGKRKVCVATENGKTYILNNLSGFVVRKVIVDGCLQQKEKERACDFLMSIDEQNNNVVYFIELKGGKLIDAIKQLHQTAVRLKDEFNNYTLNIRIVGSKDVPRIKLTPEYTKLVKLVDASNGKIKIATNKQFSENI
jgi:hypothetical protein